MYVSCIGRQGFFFFVFFLNHSLNYLGILQYKIKIKKVTTEGMLQDHRNVIAWGCDEMPVRCHVP